MAEPVVGTVGETCKQAGDYICGNCGHYKYYDEGDEFEACPMCGEEDIEWELET